jgi:hypothetical protein
VQEQDRPLQVAPLVALVTLFKPTGRKVNRGVGASVGAASVDRLLKILRMYHGGHRPNSMQFLTDNEDIARLQLLETSLHYMQGY